jgi:hypothetical protein
MLPSSKIESELYTTGASVNACASSTSTCTNVNHLHHTTSVAESQCSPRTIVCLLSSQTHKCSLLHKGRLCSSIL